MEEWFARMVTRMFDLMHVVESDNFDTRRYHDVPANAFFFEEHAGYFLFLEQRRAEFFRARSLLVDEQSRALFDQLLLFRLLGHLHVRLPFDGTAAREARKVAMTWRVETTADATDLGPLSIFAVPVGDDVLCIKGSEGNVAASFIHHQYYFRRGEVIIEPSLDDHALDVGGCFGDTALAFARSVGAEGRVYTFDPMPKHCAIMRESFEMNPDFAERITLYDFGLSDRNHQGSGSLRQGIDPGARLSDDLATRTLDSLDLPRIDFIKMDVEGAELMALKGGEQSLRRWKPRLALSLYHRPEDFFAIPLWLESLELGYRFHLDHYSIHHEETVLYAIC